MPGVVAPGAVSITVSNADGDVSSNHTELEIEAQQRIGVIGPSMGPVRGGNWITVKGVGFAIGDTTRCQAGVYPSMAYLKVRVVSSGEIMCQMPAAGLGVETVVVSDGESSGKAASEGVYTYREGPDVMGFHPSHGWMEGGSMVTVIGEHLGVKGLMCVFGTAPEVPAETVSSSTIKCASPASERRERVSFQVMDAGVEVRGFQGYFMYLERIGVAGLQPSVGPVAGGAEVRVAGSGFRQESDVTCHFGGVESAGEYVSASELMCRLPRRMEPANVTMSLSMMGIMIEGSQREFLYEDGGVILAMAPRRGPVAGGKDVELSMRNARRHVGLQCVFDGRRVTPTSIGVSSVICKSPRHARGEVSVEVWSENGGLGAGGVTYTYTRVAEVVGVRPSMGIS